MNWDSFVYEFVVGGLILLIGIILPWRSGDYSWKNRDQRNTTIMIIVLALVYFTGQLLWQLYGLGYI